MKQMHQNLKIVVRVMINICKSYAKGIFWLAEQGLEIEV